MTSLDSADSGWVVMLIFREEGVDIARRRALEQRRTLARSSEK
jgi:hypothetical protein